MEVVNGEIEWGFDAPSQLSAAAVYARPPAILAYKSNSTAMWKVKVHAAGPVRMCGGQYERRLVFRIFCPVLCTKNGALLHFNKEYWKACGY